MFSLSLRFHILVALAAGQNHGYGVYKQLLEDGSYSPIVYERSVYRELPKLIQAGLVEVHHPNIKPIRYQLTPKAMKQLRVEQRVLWDVSGLLRARL